MTIDELTATLARAGVVLQLSPDGKLRVTAPKGALTDVLRAALSRYREALMETLACAGAAGAAGDMAGMPVIVPDVLRRHEPFPMAELQASFYVGQDEGMEFHVRPHYYVEIDFDELDPARYERALNDVLFQQRHNLPVVTPDGQLRVPPEFVPLQVGVLDLRSHEPERAREQLREVRESWSRQTLPLTQWPWFACTVSLLPGGGARLHLNLNNFFSDGYGTGRLLAAAMERYHTPGQTLPELELSFRDCVLALQSLEQSPQGQAARQYWEARLPHLPDPPPLPLVPGADPRTRSWLERRKTRLDAVQWAAFKQHAAQHGLTPSNALLAVYAEVMASWSGSRHFLLNNMVTHRFPMHEQVNEMLGNFASLYPLEVDWRGEGGFVQRALRLQDQVLKDLRNTSWSGMKVLQALNQLKRTPGRATCPFVVGSGLFLDMGKDPVYSCLETPQALLDHQFWDLPDGGLLLVFDAIERFFPPGLLDSMQAAHEQLLLRLAQDAQAWPAPSFDLLPPEQREQRYRVNATSVPLPAGLLHDALWSESASAHAVAVVDGARSVTYDALRHHAARVARALRQQGCQPRELVGVLLDKGLEQVPAVYGILAAGAAYVPVDPRWPGERIHYVLRNIQSRVAVASRATEHLLPEGLARVLVDGLDDEPGDDSPAPDAQRSMRRATDVAYVIYTSGSTGTPKGVVIDHGGALNTVHDINRRFGIGPQDVVFGISSLNFDLSVYDLFGTAQAGAKLVMAPASDDPSPMDWIEAIVRHGVTVWNSVPALMQLLVDAALTHGVQLHSLRLVMLSGDWIPVTLPAQIGRVAPNAQVVSLGGATEASIWSIVYPIMQVDPGWSSVPYGKPLDNQSWHVLDDAGQDAPTWVPGHLYIGGRGVALGYWADRKKTEAAFVVHPRTGERLYRTGDLGRYLPDGNIEFLGRSDFQVKVQGYRVELGEIESVLAEHPQVSAATVTANNVAGGRQLAAFFVERARADEAGMPLTADALRAYLRSRLPAYMVPAVITQVEALPLTPNGKVDRPALARLLPSEQGQTGRVAPRDGVERQLCAMWQELLGRTQVGITDDFFDLGGQSLTAVQLITRISQAFGVRLSLGTLLEDRTIEAVARRLGSRTAWSPRVLLAEGPQATPWFLVHPAGGGVLCYRELASRLGAPCHGLQAAGLNGECEPLLGVEAMAASYLESVREVQPHGPYRLAGWSSGGVLAFEMARQLEREGHCIERLVVLDAPAPVSHEMADEAALVSWFVQDISGGAQLPAPVTGPAGAQELLAQALAAVRARGQAALPGLDALWPVYQVFRAVVLSTRAYCPPPQALKGDITVLCAEQDGVVQEYADHPQARSDDRGWSRLTRGSVHLHRVPGTHYSMLDPAHLDALVRAWLHPGTTPATDATPSGLRVADQPLASTL